MHLPISRSPCRYVCVVVLLFFPLLALQAADRPNILFILADDLGYGDLQCYGNPYLETPVLNELAANGIRFTDHYSPSPLCAPARAGYLTGRYNHRTGAIDVSSNRGIDRIDLSEKTFGNYFGHVGYATALIGKWHNGLYNRDYLPHNRGFDLFYGFPNGGQDYWKWNILRNDAHEKADGRYLTDALNDEAMAFVAKNRDQPFALFLAHHAPHSPLQAPAGLVEKYRKLGKGKYNDSVATIYAMIEAMDQSLGKLFAFLKDEGLWYNTVIVFTSDNGAYLKNAPGPAGVTESWDRFHGPFRGNKDMVLEEGIRVPAIVSWPGHIQSGQTLSTPVHGCDWLPTLFSLTGASSPREAKPLDGINIVPLLLGDLEQEIGPRFLPFQKNRYTPVAHSNASIRHGKWKLYWPGVGETIRKDGARDNGSYRRGITHPHWEMPLDPGLPVYAGIKTHTPQLFDLDEDLSEQRDLAHLHPEIVGQLSSKYNAWFYDVFVEWKQSNLSIVQHDQAYWRTRRPPDPRILFKDYWQWDRAPEGVDPETADPLQVLKGYWNSEYVLGSFKE